MSEGISRRELFRRGGLYGGGLWLAASLPWPRAARAARESGERRVLTAGQWRTVEAITARLIPTDQEPGAREAGCVNFIDKALAHEEEARRPLYEAGLAALDAVCAKRFGKAFVALEPEPQDAVLASLQDGSAEGWSGPVPAPEFFAALREHTIVGFLADPRYGGNRGFAGWKVVGYPGPRHHLGGYTPGQMRGEEPILPVWEAKGGGHGSP